MNNKEYAVTICRKSSGELVRGSEAIGGRYHVNLRVCCPRGSEPWAIWHTHPGGSTEASLADLLESKRLGIKRLCVEVPETGDMRCYQL